MSFLNKKKIKNDRLLEFLRQVDLTKISHKETLFHTHNKSDAKLMELIYQLRSFEDKKCLNKMLNIRLRRDFIKKIPRFTIKIKDGISRS